MNKPLRELMKQLPGWSATIRSRHVRLTHASGAIVTASSTPSCPRAVKNIIADCRRAERKVVKK